MRPRLSVLIASVPSRRDQARVLFDKISAQAEGLPVEILMLLDNKQRSAGLKRQALLDISRGDYVAFVDDDDDVSDDYAISLMGATIYNSDVIGFNSHVTINGVGPTLCQHSLTFENEQYNHDGFKRKPWQIHAWRGELARSARFPDNTGAEDWAWCVQMIGPSTSQVIIPRVLYHYRFNSATTEASK